MHTTHLEEPKEVVAVSEKGLQLCTSEREQRYSQCLLGLVVVGVEPVRRKLFYVGFRQAARLGLPQALGQVQQGLRGEGGGRETVSRLL